MLKINLRDIPAEERWILHGRLTAPWVRELRVSWRKNHRTEHAHRHPVVLRGGLPWQMLPREIGTRLRQHVLATLGEVGTGRRLASLA